MSSPRFPEPLDDWVKRMTSGRVGWQPSLDSDMPREFPPRERLADDVAAEFRRAIATAEQDLHRRAQVELAKLPPDYDDGSGTYWSAADRHSTYHRAVRAKADELGIDRSDFFYDNPDSVEDCVVRCFTEWPELHQSAYMRQGDEQVYARNDAYDAEEHRLELEAIGRDLLEANGYFEAPDTEALLEKVPPEEEIAPPEIELGAPHADSTREDELLEELRGAVLQIADAARESETRARAALANPDTKWTVPRSELGGGDVEGWVHSRWHQAIRDKANELHLEPATYFSLSDDALADCNPRCLNEWEELSEVAYSSPDDDRLHLVPSWLSITPLFPQETGEVNGEIDTDLRSVAAMDGEPLTAETYGEELLATAAADVYVQATLDPGQLLQVKSAALRADEAVRDPEAVAAYQAALKEELGPDVRMSHHLDVSSRAHTAWHEAIRDECADLGAGAGAYFHSDPDEIVNCGIDCLDDWPEIKTVVTDEDPFDTNLVTHLNFEAWAVAEVIEQPPSAARTQRSHPIADDDEWCESVLAEEPLVDDLGSGMGTGY